ncbi:T9SS type A sorting domain-containing protein [Hyphobacterium sp. CCMP332]|nr:T9SS type A sorting domain-containing protein [Hyphobacterium sp. CCMP332]
MEPFSNASASGYSMVVDSTHIHIVGPTYPYIDSNNIALLGYIATYAHNGNFQYFDLVGDTLRAYEAEKLLIDSNGNKYIIGDFRFDTAGVKTNQGLFVQKRDFYNAILWTVEYQDSLANIDYLVDDAVLFGSDKLAIIGGFVKQPDSVSSYDVDVLYIIIDTSGNLLTTKNLGTQAIQEGSYSVTMYDDTTVAIGARKLGNGFDKNWVIKMDYQGNVLDEYISASNRRIGVWDIVKTQDGGLACASAATDGDFISPENKSYVEKLDSNLNQVWEYTIDWRFSSNNLATSIDETPNGDIVVGGNVVDFLVDPDTAGFYCFLQKLSCNGDSIWYQPQYFYSNINSKEFHNIYDLQIYNDRIYFVGDAKDFNNPIPPGQSMWLVSTDSNGIVSSLNERISVNEGIMVYPNPANAIVNIHLSTDKEHSQIKIYDMQGKLQHEQVLAMHKTQINITSWPSGIYQYRIQNENGLVRGKFLKH